MPEVQQHGFDFQKWVKANFFGEDHDEVYTGKWDVDKELNTSLKVPQSFRGLPVSIKTVKYGSPLGLGDIIRQRSIDEEFLLVAGFWEQFSPSHKNFVAIEAIKFKQAHWNSLWGPLSMERVRELDRIVKNRALTHLEARSQAQAWLAESGISKSKIVPNPKIDSKTQRRVQCSLPFQVFWKIVGVSPRKSHSPCLWGLNFPNPLFSPPRSFSQ